MTAVTDTRQPNVNLGYMNIMIMVTVATMVDASMLVIGMFPVPSPFRHVGVPFRPVSEHSTWEPVHRLEPQMSTIVARYMKPRTLVVVRTFMELKTRMNGSGILLLLTAPYGTMVTTMLSVLTQNMRTC